MDFGLRIVKARYWILAVGFGGYLVYQVSGARCHDKRKIKQKTSHHSSKFAAAGQFLSLLFVFLCVFVSWWFLFSPDCSLIVICYLEFSSL